MAGTLRATMLVILLLKLTSSIYSSAEARQLLNAPLGPRVARTAYFTLEGCDFMLAPGTRCDKVYINATAPHAVGCCPIGFVCKQLDETQGSTCSPAPPTYARSPGCTKRIPLQGQCTPGPASKECCADGFSCVQSPTRGTGASYQCDWAGHQPPPTRAGQSAKRNQHSGKTATTHPKLRSQSSLSGQDGANGVKALGHVARATSTTAACSASCAASSLPPGCSVTNATRFQAPSCTCYDIPLFMRGAPPSLAVNSNGQWVLKDKPSELAAVKGVNWFGFNSGSRMVDGLWANYVNASIGDFPTVLKRIQLLGFNGLRLPFTFNELDQPPKAISYPPCTADSVQQFQQSLTPDYVNVSATPSQDVASVYLSPTSCPFDVNPTATSEGSMSACNKHVPGPQQDSTTWNRFFWVVQYAVGQGFYVILPNNFEQEGLQSDSAALYDQWLRFWRDLVALPTYKDYLSGRVFPDIATEWDKFGCRWEHGTAGCSTPYGASVHAAASAIAAASKDADGGAAQTPIVVVEGVGQGNAGLTWGDGFITDAASIAEQGLSDPRGFFANDSVAERGYQVVLAPHVYGPDTSGIPSALCNGDQLFSKLHRSWGSKSPAPNLQAVGVKQSYAVAVGEFGSDCNLFDGTGGCDDGAFLTDLTAYFNNAAPGLYSHNKVQMWFWWCWPANSGGTLGIVQGNWWSLGPNDYYAIRWHKIRYLESVGLIPWYTGKCMGGARSSSGGACGFANGGKCCPQGECCGADNICGSGVAFCGSPACQAPYSNSCALPVASPAPGTSSPSPMPPSPSPIPPSPSPRPALVCQQWASTNGHTYDKQFCPSSAGEGVQMWALAMDPDGLHMWAGARGTSTVYKARLSDFSQVVEFKHLPEGHIGGLAVVSSKLLVSALSSDWSKKGIWVYDAAAISAGRHVAPDFIDLSAQCSIFVSGMAISPDGKQLATVCHWDKAVIIDLTSTPYKVLTSFSTGHFEPFSVAYNRVGELFVGHSGSFGGGVSRFGAAPTYSPMGTYNTGSSDFIALSPTETELYVASAGFGVRRLDISTPPPAGTYLSPDAVVQLPSFTYAVLVVPGSTPTQLLLGSYRGCVYSAVPFRRAANDCGTASGGVCCGEGQCCSFWGHCGNTSNECGRGCQEDFGRCNPPDTQCASGVYGMSCGRYMGGKCCPGNLCCNWWGYCGSDPVEHCGRGCQQEYGSCLPKDPKCAAGFGFNCGPTYNNTCCPGTGFCCSFFGFCGNLDEHCGRGCQEAYGGPAKNCYAKEPDLPCLAGYDMRCGPANGGKCCPYGHCCDQWGWCGTQDYHCSIAQGCQVGYGTCRSP